MDFHDIVIKGKKLGFYGQRRVHRSLINPIGKNTADFNKTALFLY